MPPPYSPPPAMVADPTAVMGRRVVAYLIDGIIVFVLFVVLFLATANKVTGVPTGYCTDAQYELQRSGSCVQIGNTAYDTGGGANGILFLTSFGYWTIVGLIEGSTGAFLGKRIMGLRVVGADGNLAGPGRGAARGAMLLIDSICLVGFFVAAFTRPHRRLGDMAAGTYVIGKDYAGHPIGSAAPSSYIPYAPPTTQSQPTGGFAPGTYGTSLPPSATAPTPVADAPTPTTPTTPTAAPTPADEAPGWAAPTPPAEEQQQASPWAAPNPQEGQQPQPQQPQTWGSAPQQSSPWATPPQQQPAPQATPQPQPPQPQWDPARNAWIVWEPTRAQWLQWDANTSQWGPISQ